MSRSRRKLDTSPIDYDEIVESPALKGMISFLEVPPGQLPRLDFTGDRESKRDSQEEGIPFSGNPESLRARTDFPPESVKTPLATSGSKIEPTSPDIRGVPEKGTPGSFPPLVIAPRIRKASLAQDGHSLGEQALYDALWQSGHSHSPESRIITLGYRRMAGLARLTVNNCKANIRSLIQKLSVEEAATFSSTQGRTYIVYSFAAVLQRRRAAGLTHFVKSRGVTFVDALSGEPLTDRGRTMRGLPFSGTPKEGHSGIPDADKRGVPQSEATPYSHTIRNISSQSSSTTQSPVPLELIQALQHLVPVLDDEAVGILWHQCRLRVPDCTPDEVLHFTRLKATIFVSRKIQNPIGFLLTAVPKCFEGPTFKEFRAEAIRQQQLELERMRLSEGELRQMRAELEALLADPKATPADRLFAKRILEGQ